MCIRDRDMELLIPGCYPALISALGSNETLLVRKVYGCILKCLQKASDFSTFFKAIQCDGLSSENPTLCRNSAALLTDLAKDFPLLFSDSKYTLQLLSLIETMLADKFKFASTLIQLHPFLHQVSRMLPVDAKREYDELMVDVEFSYQPASEAERSGLRYGVIPERIAKGFDHTANWKQKIGAIEELEEIISNESTRLKLEPNIASFLEFLVKLLNDPNYKVVVTTLQIIKKILEAYTTIRPHDVQLLLPGLIEKLGDNKVMIRQLSMSSLRLIGKTLDPISLLARLLPHLSSPKWHTREEILALTMVCFIENKGSAEFFERVPYAELVARVAPLLADDKPKVIQMAFETCATIAKLGDAKQTWALLTQCIEDAEILQELKARIDLGVIPSLTPDYQLEFPYINNELTTQNTFYLQIQYNNMSTIGSQQGRFTSAGTTNKIADRNLFGVHSAANRNVLRFNV
eukprot:TRINITY_DN12935_c0_g3_i1.p1 TRINITY_DN12935_c0_g3~~TRINITY_DN12935_c0_g3_i1.p1  ORF type:complete len:475 (+),score=35.88 TRINITY_DN12935_c0_g3_i1:40-1425(+)